MRTLFFIVLFAAFGWSAYWFAGATAQRMALDGWLDQRRADGWVADARDLAVTGYPNRFDTIITGLDLADPRSGWAWSAPEFQILALSYQPNHIIAVWPGTQTIASPGTRTEIRADIMRGSVRFAANTGLALEQAIVELKTIGLGNSRGWDAALGSGQLSVRRADKSTAPGYAYDVNMTARDMILPGPVQRRLDPTGVLPDTIPRAEIRVTPVFDAPWDRAAIETGAPDLDILNVGNISFEWGAMELTVTGRLDADATGTADGHLNIIARNWREMLDIAVRAGWLPERAASTTRTALGLLAQSTGQTNRLDVTLEFRRGRIWIGPLPIGRAPRLN